MLQNSLLALNNMIRYPGQASGRRGSGEEETSEFYPTEEISDYYEGIDRKLYE